MTEVSDALEHANHLLTKFVPPQDYPTTATIYWSTLDMYREAILVFDDGRWGTPRFVSVPKTIGECEGEYSDPGVYHKIVQYLCIGKLLTPRECSHINNYVATQFEERTRQRDAKLHVTDLERLGYTIEPPQ